LDADALVVGASAAGLAAAACLKRSGQSFEILKGSDVVASVWRAHYNRLSTCTRPSPPRHCPA
jgi:cation diffusion facilitator CzcD-associated flavoprotein CzcO